MLTDRSITLKCGTTYRLADLEAAGFSYVPCGQVDGKDQPILPWSHHAAIKRQVTFADYGKKANPWTLNRMTGVQIFTGYPTFRDNKHLVDIDIEAHLIKAFPEIYTEIMSLWHDAVDRPACVIGTKSGGRRLSAFCEYLDKKYAFKDAETDEMALEIFSIRGLSRIDNRYEILEGSLLDIPEVEKSVLQNIYHLLSNADGIGEPQQVASERKVVGESQIGDLDIQWDAKGRSQYFPTMHCRETHHKSNRDEVRFTRYHDGSVDGKCFNCGGLWWEVSPTDALLKKAPPVEVDTTPSYRHWTSEERTIVREVLGTSPDAGWKDGVPAFTTKYDKLYPITGEFALNGQPSEVEKRRVWSTEFGKCESCGGMTAHWVDRYLLTVGRYCDSCHEDVTIGSYLEWEMTRKLPNSIVSEHQGFLGDDADFQDFRLWQPQTISHIGAGMATGKTTEISKEIASLSAQRLGIGIIALPRIALCQFLAHQLRKQHGQRAWGLYHEGSGQQNQFIGTQGAVVCLPSLARAVEQAYAIGIDAASLYLAIDELDFGYNLMSLATQQATAIKKCLREVLRNTGLVLSGQTESTLALEAFAAEMEAEAVQGFYNTAAAADGEVELRKYHAVDGKNACVLAGAIESIACKLQDGYNVYVFCSTRRDGEVVAKRFEAYQPVSYNAYTKGDARCNALLRNQCLPEDSQLFIGTSAAGVGISILDSKAKTVIIAGLNRGSRDMNMLVQKCVRDRGRRGVEIHYTDYNTALPVRPTETEQASLYHEEIKRFENEHVHLPKESVKRLARSFALNSLADHQFEAVVEHHLGTVGNMPVVSTFALGAAPETVLWAIEHRRHSMKTERSEKCRMAIDYLETRNLYTSHEIRTESLRGDWAQDELIAHEYANALACAVGWNDAVNRKLEKPFADVFDAKDIEVAIALAETNMNPDKLEHIRRGYLAVHYPRWVTAMFDRDIKDAYSANVEAGSGLELTAVTDDRFLGEVLSKILNALKGEVFDETDLATAIREVLAEADFSGNETEQGQSLLGRIRKGGLGVSAFRRSRFLHIGDDAFVINWARGFLKEYYPVTLSKRGDRYALVNDKRLGLILESFRCWLSKRVDGELPRLKRLFDDVDPQRELKAKARELRTAGATLQEIADEMGEDWSKIQRWCEGIGNSKETTRGKRAKKRTKKETEDTHLKIKALELQNKEFSLTRIAAELQISRKKLKRILES